MGFERLLGNQRLKENLEAAVKNNRISHFYLISGPEGSGKHTLARLLAAAAVCRGSSRPCLRCPACRKVMENNHPDVITVEDPEHKNVAVKLIRQFRDDVFIRPNEADRKVYLFPQEMGVEGQNALLKILEEPPAYGVFLLLSDNPEKLLPTVRSRCVELKLLPLPQELLRAALQQEFPQASTDAIAAAMTRSGGFLGQAKKLLSEDAALLPQTLSFAQSFGKRDPLGLLQTLAPMEKWKRDALTEILTSWLELLESALASRSGIRAVSAHARQLSQMRTAGELRAGVMTLKKALEYTQSNVSPAAICGWLSWELR